MHLNYVLTDYSYYTQKRMQTFIFFHVCLMSADKNYIQFILHFPDLQKNLIIIKAHLFQQAVNFLI